jgi:hypothetical protein
MVFNWAPFRVINRTLPNRIDTNRTPPHGWWLDGVGKFSWTHNPSSATEYKVTTTRGYCSPGWRWVAVYQMAANTVTCPGEPDPVPRNYVGTCKVKKRLYTSYSDIHYDTCSTAACHAKLDGQTRLSYEVEVSGLRPGVKHDFFSDGEKKNARVQMVGNVLGNRVQPDDTGKAKFIFWDYVIARKALGRKKKCELVAPYSYASFEADAEGTG